MFDSFDSFWTLGANTDAYRHEEALIMAREKGLSPEGVRMSRDFERSVCTVHSIFCSICKALPALDSMFHLQIFLSFFMRFACTSEFRLWTARPTRCT